MSTLLQRHGLESLTPEERLALADALRASVAVIPEDEPIDPAVIAEMERRAALSDADPSRLIPWEDVLAESRARWGR